MALTAAGVAVTTRRARDWRRLERVLRAGTWCWPTDDDALATLAERGLAMPSPEVGRVLLVAESASGGSLWALRKPCEGEATFGAEASRAWERAGRAVARAVPVAWGPFDESVGARPEAAFLARAVRPGHQETDDAVLDGASFGLTFVLALVSRCTQQALPEDWAASATVDDEGRVGPVDGLEAKIEALVQHAPRVRRLLVAATQREEAAGFARGCIEIVAVETAAQAIAVVAPDLEKWMVEVAEPEARRERVEAVYRLALGSRAAYVDWGPVERAAAGMAEAWRELEPELVGKLRFVESVASRHQGRRHAAKAPDEAMLSMMPQPLRTRHLAHAVQNAADAGAVDLGAIEALAWKHMPERLVDCFPAHLELRGALARLAAVTGRPREAAESQLALALAWVERGESAAATHGLSEAFRLAGALGDATRFEAAEVAYRRAMAAGDVERLGGRVYVEVSKARGLALLGRWEAAAAALAPWAERSELPDHLRLMVSRWQALVARWRGDARALEAAERVLAAPARHAHLAERTRALAALDVASLDGDEDGAAEAMATLARSEPEPVGQLRRAWKPTLWPTEADWVARFYPY